MYQFLSSNSTHNGKMSIEEIREACVRSENIRASLESFLWERCAAAPKFAGPSLLLTATPLVVRDEVLDTRDPGLRGLMSQPRYRRSSGWTKTLDT